MKKSSLLPSLTEKEMNVLLFIEASLAERGLSPSYQEIKDHFGFASFNSVQNYLKQLLHKGYIAIPSNQKRAIQILHSANSVQQVVQNRRAQATVRGPAPKATPEREGLLSLPLLGKVAAGAPLESFTNDEFVDVPPSLVRNASKTFALRVSGSSMVGDGIHDGDIILVQKQAQAGNGEIVVASVENESTVKRYFLRSKPSAEPAPKASRQMEPEASSKMVELRPANPSMQSMWYPPDQVHIQGVLVGLIRKF